MKKDVNGVVVYSIGNTTTSTLGDTCPFLSEFKKQSPYFTYETVSKEDWEQHLKNKLKQCAISNNIPKEYCCFRAHHLDDQSVEIEFKRDSPVLFLGLVSKVLNL